MKIIKIDGIRGIITAIFVVCCLFAGFVIAPGVLVMHLWNKYLVNLLSFPQLNLFQGVIFWGILFHCYYLIIGGKIPISFQSTKELSDAEINMIMKQVDMEMKMQKFPPFFKKTKNIDNNSINNPFPTLEQKESSSKTNDNNTEDTGKISNLK